MRVRRRKLVQRLRRPEFLKVATYGAMHFCVAIAVAFALTGDIRLALAVGIVEPIVQTVAFAVHERIWARFGGPPPGDAGGHAVLASALNSSSPEDDSGTSDVRMG
jgi:uncharacterized membrane protein